MGRLPPTLPRYNFIIVFLFYYLIKFDFSSNPAKKLIETIIVEMYEIQLFVYVLVQCTLIITDQSAPIAQD